MGYLHEKNLHKLDLGMILQKWASTETFAKYDCTSNMIWNSFSVDTVQTYSLNFESIAINKISPFWVLVFHQPIFFASLRLVTFP